MKIITFNVKKNKLLNNKKRVIAIGKFTSFHKGHQKVFKQARKIAREENKELIILMYTDYDGIEKKDHKNVIPLETRLELIEKYHPNIIILFQKNKKNYSLTREEFFKYLKEKLNVSDVVVGKNFNLNKNDGKDDLLEFEKVFNLTVIPLEKYKNQIISTTLLETLIFEGKFENYHKLTNFNYFYKGTVVPGKLLGTKYKTPTANINVFSTLFPPKSGIYFSYIHFDNKKYYSLTSISTNPTLNEKKLSYETFILKFDNNIYGKNVTVELLKYLRESKKFDSLKEMYKEIENDKKRAKLFFNL